MCPHFQFKLWLLKEESKFLDDYENIELKKPVDQRLATGVKSSYRTPTQDTEYDQLIKDVLDLKNNKKQSHIMPYLNAKAAGDENKAAEIAKQYVDNYTKDVHVGFAMSPAPEELAAVIYAAKNGYPPNTKHNAYITPQDVQFYSKDPKTVGYQLAKMVRDLNIPYKEITPEFMVIGKDIDKLEKLRQDTHDAFKTGDAEAFKNATTETGKLLGYLPKAIDLFTRHSQEYLQTNPIFNAAKAKS